MRLRYVKPKMKHHLQVNQAVPAWIAKFCIATVFSLIFSCGVLSQSAIAGGMSVPSYAVGTLIDLAPRLAFRDELGVPLSISDKHPLCGDADDYLASKAALQRIIASDATPLQEDYLLLCRTVDWEHMANYNILDLILYRHAVKTKIILFTDVPCKQLTHEMMTYLKPKNVAELVPTNYTHSDLNTPQGLSDRLCFAASLVNESYGPAREFGGMATWSRFQAFSVECHSGGNHQLELYVKSYSYWNDWKYVFPDIE